MKEGSKRGASVRVFGVLSCRWMGVIGITDSNGEEDEMGEIPQVL